MKGIDGDMTELRHLQYFLAVVREENISRAAEALHVTQPTLSRQMAELEEELGTRLFIRGRHIERLGIVGGPTINTGFLNAGLLDEVILLIGPGIDGRASMPSVFEGRQNDQPLPLRLDDVKVFDDGAVLLKYCL